MGRICSHDFFTCRFIICCLDSCKLDSTGVSFRKAQLLYQIQGFYSLQSQLLVQDRYMFDTPLQEWNTRSATQIHRWICQYGPVIRKCLRLAHLQAKASMPDIRTFLSSPPPVPPATIPSTPPRVSLRTSLRQTTLRGSPVSSVTSKPSRPRSKIPASHDIGKYFSGTLKQHSDETVCSRTRSGRMGQSSSGPGGD